MKKDLKITFVNPNKEEQIVQAMAGVIAYNLAENDKKVKFDYKDMTKLDNQKPQPRTQKYFSSHGNSNSNTHQNSLKDMEEEEFEM